MSANSSKLEQLVLYIVGRVGDPAKLGATKLHKILWFSETSMFARTGHPISDAFFVRAPRGPFSPNAEKAIKALCARNLLQQQRGLYGNHAQRQLIATREADLSLFTAEEISVVDRWIETIAYRHTARSISEASHDRMWHLIPDGAPMPLDIVFGAQLEPPDSDDLEWARTALGDRTADDMVAEMTAG